MLKTIDILIGLSVVMLLLSMIVTVITQFVNNALSSRGKHLLQGIADIMQQIDPGISRAIAEEISRAVLSHPLVSDANGRLGSVIHREELTKLLLELASEQGPQKLSPGALKALQDALAATGVCDAGTPDQIKQQISAIIKNVGLLGLQLELSHPELTNAARARIAMLQQATSQFLGKINLWFDQTMDRVGDRFTQHTRYVTFFGSLLIAVLLQLDVAALVSRLSADDALRNSLVAQAEKTQGVQLSGAELQNVHDLMTNNLVGVPLSFSDWTSRWSPDKAPTKALGIILSAVLLSLGAPFWYNALQNLIRLRSIVAVKDDQQRQERQLSAPPRRPRRGSMRLPKMGPSLRTNAETWLLWPNTPMSQVIHKIWIGCDPSNFLNGRRGFAPEAIVIHRTGAPLGGIDSRCKQSNLHCSSHYAVGTGGEVHQYIDEKDTAFHAGIVVAATWKLLKGGKNPNLYTIAIEQEGAGNNPPSDLQYETTAALVSEIAQRWKIRIDAEHIVLHSEIRAGVGCPDSSFDRTKLLSLVTTNQGNVPLNSHLSDEVNLITDANVRDSPRLTARIVRIARAEASETISGFEDQGERINGNSCWYSTADGNYLWAGATDKPNPVRMTRLVTETAPTPPQPSAGSAKFGIQSLDDLLSKDNAAPICADAEPLAVGAIQDLLTGHGLPGLPTIATAQYGRWTPKTTAALQAFQKTGGLDVAASVDRRALQNMLNTPVSDPRASEVYLKLVLQAPSTGLHKILSLVAQMEGAGKFAAVNRNTDRAGLSFGLIQWAQKPGRLSDILVAMSASERALFITIFGNGDSAVADALVSHCRKPFGGVDPKTGETVSAAFNLIEEPWLSRFRQSALAKRFQQVQVQVALEAFSISYSRIRGFAPDLISERSVAFMLDVANQWGNSGVQKLYNDVHRPEMSETDLLEAIAEESVARMDDSLKAGVRGRREQFLQTPFLSDRPFVMDCS